MCCRWLITLSLLLTLDLRFATMYVQDGVEALLKALISIGYGEIDPNSAVSLLNTCTETLRTFVAMAAQGNEFNYVPAFSTNFYSTTLSTYMASFTKIMN